MSPQAWLLVGTIITATATLVGTWLLLRQQGRQSKTTDAQQIIDQLQEMRAADEERHQREATAAEERHLREIAEVRAQVDKLEHRVGRMESRELAFFDYASALRWHIELGKGPPPPPWPAALMNRD